MKKYPTYMKRSDNAQRSNEEYIMTAYLLGWSGDWSRMKKALSMRLTRLRARKYGYSVGGVRSALDMIQLRNEDAA